MPEVERWRAQWGLHTSDTLRVRVRELGGSDAVIKGLLPARSLGVLVGDSGLGKSPLVYQAGICVAAGMPFLGHETWKGRVVIADFENGIADMDELVDRIGRYVGVTGPLDDLQLWTLNDCLPSYGQYRNTLLDILGDVRPALAIIDSLASYQPEAEEKNSAATRMLHELRGLARDCGTTSLLVHHRRKQPRKADESAGPIEKAILRQWFQDSRGASALINGTDIRLGVDEPDLGAVGKEDVALVLRGFGRIRGDLGPLHLARDVDDAGDPAGYRLLTGPELLFNSERQEALAALSPRFTFKEAKQTYGRADQPTSNWLQRCMQLRLVHKVSRGIYEKIESGEASGNGAQGE